MKKLSLIFGILTILSSHVACAVVAYTYCNMKWLGETGASSAPESVAFLYLFPFALGIFILAILAIRFWKRSKR